MVLGVPVFKHFRVYLCFPEHFYQLILCSIIGDLFGLVLFSYDLFIFQRILFDFRCVCFNLEGEV